MCMCDVFLQKARDVAGLIRDFRRPRGKGRDFQLR